MATESILVLGNGFNSDLGLKRVGYKDFFESPEWKDLKSRFRKSPLIKFIHRYYKRKPFFYNIEDILLYYTQRRNAFFSHRSILADKKAFFELEEHFSKYVSRGIKDSRSSLDVNSYAYHVWYDFEEEKRKTASILPTPSYYLYTFNYVVLDDVASIINGPNAHWSINLPFPEPIIADYIHGRIDGTKKGAHIIFGLSRTYNTRYNFMIKENHPNYIPEKKKYLTDSLLSADSIVLFGVSFSHADKNYFSRFFNSFNGIFEKGKQVTIYDYDEDGIQKCFENIRKMVDNETFKYIKQSVRVLKTKK